MEIWRCKEGSCLGSGCIHRWHFYAVHTVFLHADILALITSNSSICLTTTAQIIYDLSICLTWVSFYALNPLIFFSHLLIQGFFDDQFPALKRFLPGHLSSTGADDDDDDDEWEVSLQPAADETFLRQEDYSGVLKARLNQIKLYSITSNNIQSD